MGVEIFKSAQMYRDWARVVSNKRVVSVVIFKDEIVVTWELV